MNKTTLIAGTCAALLLAACTKTRIDPTTADTAPPAADMASAKPVATPAPAPVIARVAAQPETRNLKPATSAPAAPELAPPGVFYLITTARIETADGITGLPPGTGVKLLRDDLYLTPAGQAHLRPDQLTNDMAVARAARDADRATQNTTKATLAAQADLAAMRQRTAATGPNTAQTAGAADNPVAVATPVPLGSSLSRPQDALNTTHSSTKDKVYTDSQGRKYWKDIFGKAHYF